MAAKIKVTYATLSADNEELQSGFDGALARVKSEWLGAVLPLYIDGERLYTEATADAYSPINTDWLLSSWAQGDRSHSQQAIAAAKRAFPVWRRTPWQERVSLIRAIAESISAQLFELSALMSLEIGKNRLESLGEVEETADLLRWYADDMQRNDGYRALMGKFNPNDPAEHNESLLRPHGVWAVISPFNFPMALSAAPIAAALLAGNTVVFKGAAESPYSNWMTAELFIAAGLPAGVFNAVSGPDESVGQELLDNPGVDGFTFTGSYGVGMKVLRAAARGPAPRPAIVEMGGKNPAIVSATADLDKAAYGVMRSAFGLNGQKCSACSRVYVQASVYDAFAAKLLGLTAQIRVGDPTRRDVYMGTLIHADAYANFQRWSAQARQDGHLLTGGQVLTDGELAKGYFVTPTIVAGLAEDHPLVREELFVPLLHLAKVESLDEAMEKANASPYGLTAGFFGEEVEWFLENIQAGTLYTNRAAGATTGAWPGVQAFGGWKASGSSGKGIGARYTLPLYMREQSRTLIG